MKLSDLTFERIENYDPFNSRAKSNGMVSERVARNDWGNAVAFGDTKKECLEDARRYVAIQNRKLRADINPATLCEYTGKLDHNKKRIWEHDIVRVTNTYNTPATVSWYLVRYREDEAAFVFTDPKELMFNHMGAFHDMCHIEVMGNEFDNPELLENIRCQTPAEFQTELDAEMRKRGIKYD